MYASAQTVFGHQHESRPNFQKDLLAFVWKQLKVLTLNASRFSATSPHSLRFVRPPRYAPVGRHFLLVTVGYHDPSPLSDCVEANSIHVSSPLSWKLIFRRLCSTGVHRTPSFDLTLKLQIGSFTLLTLAKHDIFFLTTLRFRYSGLSGWPSDIRWLDMDSVAEAHTSDCCTWQWSETDP